MNKSWTIFICITFEYHASFVNQDIHLHTVYNYCYSQAFIQWIVEAKYRPTSSSIRCNLQGAKQRDMFMFY